MSLSTQPKEQTVLFLANENFPLASIILMRQQGHDVVSVSETASGMSDVEVLSWARRENRVILTFDRDYGELIYLRGLSVPQGLVYFRETPKNAEFPAKYLISILNAGQVILENRFTVVESGQVRQRSLPSV